MAEGGFHGDGASANGAAQPVAAARRGGTRRRRDGCVANARCGALVAQEQARHGLRQLRALVAIGRRAARPARRAASSASGRATAPRAPRRRPRRSASSLRARAISAARHSSACALSCLDQRHRAALVEPVHEALHAGLDDGLGLRHRGLRASRRPVCTTLRRGRRPCRGRRRERASTSGSMSRGTARSTMNIGRCRRAFSARSTAPRPMIGSELAVQRDDDVELGQPRRQVGQRASPRRRSGAASFSPRSSVRLATAMRLAAGAPRSGSPPARSSRRRRRTARCVWRRSSNSCAGQAHRGGRHADRVGADLGRACALPWRPRTSAGTAGAAWCRARRRCRPRAPRPSSGRGSAARPAPSNRARWRRGTRGAPPRPSCSVRRASAAGAGAHAADVGQPVDAWARARRWSARARRSRCGCRSRRSRPRRGPAVRAERAGAGCAASGAIWSMANAKRPRRSSGAVVWFRPRAQTDIARIIK